MKTTKFLLTVTMIVIGFTSCETEALDSNENQIEIDEASLESKRRFTGKYTEFGSRWEITCSQNSRNTGRERVRWLRNKMLKEHLGCNIRFRNNTRSRLRKCKINANIRWMREATKHSGCSSQRFKQ